MAVQLWLIGMMGSGKSATARVLAQRLGMEALDTDEDVEMRTGCSVAKLWGERGERAFRSMERAAIERAAAGPAAVVSTGGGVVLDPANVSTMRSSGKVVWLSGSPAALSARVGDGSGRPLLDQDSSETRLAEILEDRAALYEAAADVVVDTTDSTIDETADRIEEWWNAS